MSHRVYIYNITVPEKVRQSNNEIYPADKEMVREDIQDRYSDYYFNVEIMDRLKAYIKDQEIV